MYDWLKAPFPTSAPGPPFISFHKPLERKAAWAACVFQVVKEAEINALSAVIRRPRCIHSSPTPCCHAASQQTAYPLLSALSHLAPGTHFTCFTCKKSADTDTGGGACQARCGRVCVPTNSVWAKTEI